MATGAIAPKQAFVMRILRMVAPSRGTGAMPAEIGADSLALGNPEAASRGRVARGRSTPVFACLDCQVCQNGTAREDGVGIVNGFSLHPADNSDYSVSNQITTR
jgi:hypothetical protein